MTGAVMRQEAELEVAELKALTFYAGMMRMETIKNEHIREPARVRNL